jgi:hypothetical protein
MSGSHQDICDRQLAAGLDEFFGFIEDGSGDHATIGHHERESGFAIIENESASVEWIVKVRGFVLVHVPFDGKTHPRGYICQCGAGMKPIRNFSGLCLPGQ